MSLFSELKRRNVFRVGAAYAAVSWLVIQIAETTFPAFGLGEAALRVVIVVLSVCFIPTLIFAWAFELTPEGFKRDSEIDRSSPVTRRMTKRLDRLIMVVLALALGYFAFDKFVLSPQRQAEELATATEAARLEGRTQAIVESYGDKSIAVLPFADLSPEGDQQYFSDGISEELLNLLARVRELRVISRSSSFALRDQGLSVPEVAKKLNVSYVLEGSVRKAGDKVRITAQLIEAPSDTHLWSDTYDRKLDDIFAIQDQISTRVVSELKVRLLGPAPTAETTNLSAYDLYLQGRSFFAQPRERDAMRAINLFEEVAEIVPDYAPAHASLAVALIFQADHTRDANESRIEAAARRALELDPGNSDALTALGRIQWFRGQVDEAKATLERAIKSNPSNPLAYRWLGSTYINRDPVRYLSLVEQAFLIDPLFRGNFEIRMFALNRLGRHRQALEVARSWSEAAPPGVIAYLHAGRVHVSSGRNDLGLKSAFEAFRADPDWGLESASWWLCNMGDFGLANTWVEALASRKGSAPAELRALIAKKLDSPGEAARILTDAHQRGELSDQEFGYWVLRLIRDFTASRDAYEQAFAKMDRDILVFDPDLPWINYLDYALILQQSGETDKADVLLDQISPLIEKQIADGVVLGFAFPLQLRLAELRAIRGDKEQAVAALREAAKAGFTAFPYLREAPQFDSLREDPAYQQVYHEIESESVSQRQRLADEGMLLTPDEVLQLEDYSFDPFAY